MSSGVGEMPPTAEPSIRGESTSGGQPIMMPLKRHSAFESPMEQQQQTRKLPQRKRSVFSFNGFPDIQLLDQQAIKTRLASADQDAAEQTLIQTAKGVAIEPTTSDTITKALSRAQPPPLPPQHQPRSDTLGSTGSSRASSCDEPTIVTGTTLSSRLSAADCSPQPEIKTGTKQHEQQQKRKISSTILNGTSSSGSSIDSMGAGGWSSKTIAAKTAKTSSDMLGQQNTSESTTKLSSKKDQQDTKQQPKLEQTNSSNSNKDATTTTTNDETDSSLAFKSIKRQLKRNSIPNAQLIQQHIDNLIRHNESIVDNWNLVSIRSYNSSRDLQPPSATSSSFNIATTTTTNASASNKRASLPSEELQEKANTQMANNNSKLSLPKPTGSKRWSTSLLPSGCYPPVSASDCDTKKLMPPAGGLERKRSSQLGDGGCLKLSSSSLLNDSLLSQKSTLDRTSLDSSTCMSVSTSPKQSKSPSATYDLARMHLHNNPHPQQQDPVQLECAIQNLSIKRKDSEHQHPMLLMQQQQQQQQLHQENHITRQAFFPAPDPNLIQLNHQDQERQQIVAAAMLLERHRRSLVEQQMSIESQAALMRQQQQQQQQQMIESQVEQLRLALALEQHQQQLACTINSASKQQVLATVNSSSNSNNNINDIDQHHHHFGPRHQHHFASCGLTTPGQHPTLIDNLVARLFEQEGLLKRQEQQQHHLDSGKPAFRCDTCDVSFWTNDLLNYHRMTQCAATRIGGDGDDNHQQPPLAFTFSGPNNFDNQELARQQYHQSVQLSKSVSPPRRTSVIDPLGPLASLVGQQQQHQQMMIAAGQVYLASPQLLKGNLEDLSILKRQLLTVQPDATLAAAKVVTTSAVPLGSLPFKKRKISEPNMRY